MNPKAQTTTDPPRHQARIAESVQSLVRFGLRLCVCAVWLLTLTCGARSASAQTFPSPSLQPAYAAYGYGKKVYELDPGPHLFVDWRYIQAGRTVYHLPGGKALPRYGGDPAQMREIIGDESEVPHGIHLASQPATIIGPVIPNDVENSGFGYETLLFFDGKYRMFYEAGGAVRYAESDDAEHWTKPKLGVVEFSGSKENNIIFNESIAGVEPHTNSVFIDPAAPPEKRLRMVYMVKGGPEEIAKLKSEHPECVSPLGEEKSWLIRLASSPDGVHWTPEPDPLMCHMSDSQTTLYYDEVLKRYVGFFRISYMSRRAIGRSEAPKLKFFPVPRTVLYPTATREPSDDYYISGYCRYPGTRTMHLMLVSVFKRDMDSTAIRLASSVDGEAWDWVPGADLALPGETGTWDGGCIFGGINLTEIPGDRVASPFTGFAYPHKFPRYETRMGQIGLLTWPRHRLSAVVVDDVGEFHTVPLSPKGHELFLNFDTRRNGYVQVEVCDQAGKSFTDCDPLLGNEMKRKVTWKGKSEISAKAGEGLSLHFKLKAARLFSFEFE